MINSKSNIGFINLLLAVKDNMNAWVQKYPLGFWWPHVASVLDAPKTGTVFNSAKSAHCQNQIASYAPAKITHIINNITTTQWHTAMKGSDSLVQISSTHISCKPRQNCTQLKVDIIYTHLPSSSPPLFYIIFTTVSRAVPRARAWLEWLKAQG